MKFAFTGKIFQISKWWTNDTNESRLPTISNTATVNSTQMQDCHVGDNAFIDEKTSLKQCHIGPNARVQSKTRISQSVIMENVTIKQR